MFESRIKLRIDSNRWEKIKEKFSDVENEEIVYNLIDTYFKNKTLKKNFLNLQNKIESNTKLQKKQEKKLFKLEKEYNEAIQKYSNLKGQYRNIVSENKELKNNPIIKEKIVYKENTVVIDALRRKRDKLKKKNHNLLMQIEQLENNSKKLQDKLVEKEKNIKDLQKKNYALLLEISHPNIIPEIKIIDSKTYYQYKTNPEKFKRKYGLNPNFIVKELTLRST